VEPGDEVSQTLPPQEAEAFL